MMNYPILKQCPLFAGMDEEQIAMLLPGLEAKVRACVKDDFIFHAGQSADSVGVVLSGGANVIQEDFWGNRTILTHVGPGQLFGEAFCCAGTEKLPVSVIAAEATGILLLHYRKIITACPQNCSFHTELISNMMRILANKNIMLTRKMEHISRRTTREKLLSFLSACAVQAGGSTITIPFNRQELADYLCVERSALSRELGRMKQDGLLEVEKNRFVLL